LYPVFFINILILFSAIPTFGGYWDMKNEMDKYEPPAYFQSLTETEQTQKITKKENENFNNEKSAINSLKSDWEKSLKTFGDENSFYQPDAQALKKLESASSDKDRTIGILKKGFTLETLEIFTLLRNAGIKSARKKVRAEMESFTQVSNLDETLRQYTAFTEGLMNGIGPMRGKDSIKMKFPFPGVTALKGQVVNQSVTAAKENLEIARRDAITNAEKVYWNLVYIHKAKGIISETLEMFRRLESVANTRYKAGKTSFQDIIKVTIKTQILEENLITLREKQKNLESALVALMDLPSGTGIGKPTSQNPGRKIQSLDSLYKKAGKNRQELRRMQAMIAKMENMIEIAETMILPNFTLNLSYYEDEAAVQTGSFAMKPAFPETTSASIGAGLPQKPWFGTNNAWLNQTRQTLDALKQDLKKAETATNNMVRNTWFELDKSIREAALFQNTIIDLSKSALDVSTRGYESGSVSFADVIGSYTNWLNVRLSLARKKSDIGVSRAELEKVVGKK
ncbi:TolC family protein, partial [Desulfobacterales bacterium HSG17]|nr:TolC family protein [Desulfobacterales bacterium HSG17]